MEDQGLMREIHEMRADFKTFASKLSELTEVMIRKEETDRFLERRVEQLEHEREQLEPRIRRVEDFITRSNPWLSFASKVLVFVACLGAAIWLGLK